MMNDIANALAIWMEQQGDIVDNKRFKDLFDEAKKRVDLTNLPKSGVNQHINLAESELVFTDIVRYCVDIVDKKKNNLLVVEEYTNSIYLVADIIRQYIFEHLRDKKLVRRILYVDTLSILNDYKKMITNNEISSTDVYLTNDYSSSLRDVYIADYVIWDNFSCISSNYDNSKIQDIISARNKECLGNLFIVRGELPDIAQFDIVIKNHYELTKSKKTIKDVTEEEKKIAYNRYYMDILNKILEKFSRDLLTCMIVDKNMLNPIYSYTEKHKITLSSYIEEGNRK